MIAIKRQEHKCLKLMRAGIGIVIGAIAGALMPLAQWGVNIWDKHKEKNTALSIRWPSTLSLMAAAAVMIGSFARFGSPILWFYGSVEIGLAIYGAIQGAKLGWQKELSAVYKKLWNISDPKVMMIIHIPSKNLDLTHSNGLTKKQKIWEGMKGTLYGLIGGVFMPLAQNIKYIHAAKRRWPFIIDTCINFYAIYVGGLYFEQFVGEPLDPEQNLSLELLKDMAILLGAYGSAKGAYIGYNQDAMQVLPILWRGGFTNTALKPKSISVLEEITISNSSRKKPPLKHRRSNSFS